MKKLLCRMLVVLLVLVSVCPAAYARISGINVLGVRMAENEPVMYLELRAMDSTSTAAKPQYVKVNLYGTENKIELQPEPMGSESFGHIIVVDTSVYYHTSGKVKSDDVRNIVSEYLTRISSEERVMFILAGDGDPVVEDYMSAGDARAYVSRIEFGKQASACINTAIYQAFQYAISPAQNAPMFNSVFIVADPDIQSNTGDHNTLDESASLRTWSDLAFDVIVAVPRREEFLTGSSAAPTERRKAVSDGLDQYKSFCSKIGGQFIAVPQTNSGITSRDLHEALTGWTDTAIRYRVDYSALAGYVPAGDGEQQVPLTISCSDASGAAEIVRSITVYPELLPEPNWTPEPELTPDVPTPTPAPTPVIWLDQKDEKAVRAIHELHKLGYLSKSGYSSFNSECMSAYYTFCEVNALDPRDGIYEDTLNLILSGSALPMPTAVPEATPTPVPTVPPAGLRINDQDSGDSTFISQLQQELTRLNCYLPGAKSTPGRMDQATLDAVNRYCEGYNWRNDYVDGVDAKLCVQIIENSGDLNPLPDIEPSLWESIQAFLARKLEIGSLKIDMWIPVAACGALVIIIITVLLFGGSKEKKTVASAPVAPAAPAAADSPAGSTSWTAPAGNPDETEIPYSKIQLTISIEYEGSVRSESIELSMGNAAAYTIGRENCQLLLNASDKSLSRRHAELRYKNGQIYLRDTSTYHNTTVNGLRVRAEGDGDAICNGDRLQLSQHYLTIRW